MSNQATIAITLRQGNLTADANVPEGADIGHLRSNQYRSLLDEIGAPSSFNFSVNSRGVEDSHVLAAGDVVGFRPKQGEKGSDGSSTGSQPGQASSLPEVNGDAAAQEEAEAKSAEVREERAEEAAEAAPEVDEAAPAAEEA